MGISIREFIEIVMAVFNTLMGLFNGLNKEEEAPEA